MKSARNTVRQIRMVANPATMRRPKLGVRSSQSVFVRKLAAALRGGAVAVAVGLLGLAPSFASPGTAIAPGDTLIGTASNAAPKIVTRMVVTCPAGGVVLVSGSGESTAVSTGAGAAFIGLAYSIARDSTATDNGNVIQSSALANFAGDSNSDILNLQRVDNCTPGQSYTYSLTVYGTTAATSAASYVSNGRLMAGVPYSRPGTGFATGSTLIGSASNSSPTIVSTLPVTCPASGAVLITGAGESAALSTNPGTAFIGFAYSIARDSFATDNTNVVQSSALAVFNGDANRDFLNVQRVDSCTPGSPTPIA